MRRSSTIRALGIAAVISTLSVLPLQSADAATKSTVSIKLSTASASTGARVVVSGQATPKKTRTISVQRYSSGKWRSLVRGRTTGTGKYSVLLNTATAGRYSYRVVASATSRYRAATSKTLALNLSAPVPPVTPLGSASAYSLIRFDGRAARWDPCTSVGYQVNPNGAPAGWDTDIRGALARITARSGLQFNYLGTTTKLPGVSPRTTDGLLIGYARPGESPRISKADGKHIAGVGGPIAMNVATADGMLPIVAGEVLLNLDIIKGLPAGFGIGNAAGYQGTRGQLVMHELGHAVGVGHAPSATANRDQIMYPQMNRMFAELGAGDITGLTEVGATKGCVVPKPDPGARTAPQRVSVLMH